MVCAVVSGGKLLIPTREVKAHNQIKRGRAAILEYRTFTIRTLDREDGAVLAIEYKCDTGYQIIDISIWSIRREFFSEE